MSQYFAPHPENPQPRLMRQAAQIVRDGGVIALPTDSCYALACHLDDKDAVTRLRRIRGIDEKHHLALLCRDLSEIAQYAQVDNVQYRLLKATTPGPYVFILPATKEVPKRVSHPSRKTIGLRVPANAIAQALLVELGGPLLSSTLIMPGESTPLNDGPEIRARLEKVLDLVLDGGACGIEPSTVIDLTAPKPQLVRAGVGELAPFGLESQDTEVLQ
jgi:tRNA threonylcarbamoyl adenosine modification protein (Sua5/YciO/YrdC/YwlC family)